MTLLVHTYVYDADGKRDFLEDPEYADTMAGFESTRSRLWGSEAIRDLGARFFPSWTGVTSTWSRPRSTTSSPSAK